MKSSSSASVGGRAPREDADLTRIKIREAAELLFSQMGFHGVSVRDVARECNVDAALVHYHFGSKAELYSTALLSRAEGFMREREAALETCISDADGKPSLEDVIKAYTKPYLVHAASGDKGWRAWFRLLAKANLSPEWAPDVWSQHFNPFVQKFIDAMKLAAPGAPEGHYFWCYHFFAGALVATFADTGRMDDLSSGTCQSNDLSAGYDLLVPFFATAFDQILSGNGHIRTISMT